MKKFRSILALALIGVMLFGITACAPTQADKLKQEFTLNLWHQWTNETDSMGIALNQAVKDYMAAHSNVKIEVHMLENEAYKTKISTEFAGSASGIDVFFYWGGGRGGKLAEAGKLLPLDEYIPADVKAKIKPGSDDLLKYGGKLYAPPMYSWMMVLYCNKEMIEGVGAKVPGTYDELVDACTKLRASGVEAPIAQGIKEQWQAAFVYEAMAIREVGAETINKMFLGEYNGFSDPGYLTAAQRTNELFKIGAFGSSPLEIDNGTADIMFLSGKSAMRLQGNWFTEQIWASPDSVVDGKIVPVNIPTSSTGKGEASDYCGGFIDTFFVNKNTKNPDIAADFVVYLTQELGRVRQETGQGFTGWTTPVDESQLPQVGKDVSAVASTTIKGAVAWDTGLDEAKAAVHLDAVQALFTADGDPARCVAEHAEGIK